MRRVVTWLVLATALASSGVQASEFWIDPINGKAGNDGSASAPWRSLQEVLDQGLVESQNWDALPYKDGAQLVPRNSGASVRGGDTIYLRSGYYGELLISGFYNTENIRVVAAAGHEPRFRRVRVRAASHWFFAGLHISAEYAPSYERTTLFELDSHGWHGPIRDIEVRECQLRSLDDSSGWSADDWDTLSCNGIRAEGDHMTIRDNVLKNVNNGILVSAAHSLVEGNVVENFAGDGMQGTGDHITFQYNTVKNCYDVNGNHDDGFQSWAPKESGSGPTQRIGIVLRGNTIINYEDPNQPHRGGLQGIGCFGGGFVDFVIENNVIITDHGHGITLKGAKNTRIVNNTVLTANKARSGPARIMITAPEGSDRCEGCVVRNNLASAIGINKTQGIAEDHNLIIRQPAKLFVDAQGYDLRLKKRSRAVDSGSAKLAPDTDITGAPRPWGGGYDIGAYEYREGEGDVESTAVEAGTEVSAGQGVAATEGGGAPSESVDTEASPDSLPTEPPPPSSPVAVSEQSRTWTDVVRPVGIVLLALSLLLIAWRMGR